MFTQHKELLNLYLYMWTTCMIGNDDCTISDGTKVRTSHIIQKEAYNFNTLCRIQ